MLQSIHDGEIDPNLIFFSDEAWFYLNGEVNTQNSRYWSDSNPRLIHEVPLHDSKIGVWCGFRQDKIVGPIFFEGTINSQRYILSIHRPFFELLNEHNRRFAFFQQDSATPHTARDSIEELRQVFRDRIISRGLWPARSPDLNPCDFYLWGNLKQKVYKTNPHTIEELKENIRNEVSQFHQVNSE
jgi:inhibitor of nuclear factor kappa-B kinase subunit alpha